MKEAKGNDEALVSHGPAAPTSCYHENSCCGVAVLSWLLLLYALVGKNLMLLSSFVVCLQMIEHEHGSEQKQSRHENQSKKDEIKNWAILKCIFTFQAYVGGLTGSFFVAKSGSLMTYGCG